MSVSKLILVLLSALLLLTFSFNQALANNNISPSKSAEYVITIDLKNATKDNKVKVVVKPPKVKEKFATYVIPTSGYGGYDKVNLSELIENFTASDASGKVLPIEYISKSQIVIANADHLAKIEYWIKDGKDIKNANFYQPTAIKIQANKNFIINHNGFYGYLTGYMHLPFQINILKPTHWHGASALHPISSNDTLDIFLTNNYFGLFESPVMYSEADTITFKVGKTAIHIAVYSETGIVSARKLYYIIKPLTKALEVFMGSIPTNEYHFIMYFAQKEETPTRLSQYGGLMCGGESSFYVLPELRDHRKLEKMVHKIASHEFLHLLTPHQLHSPLAQNVGFSGLPMSKHLWLYEGVTEYFSLLSRTKLKVKKEQMLSEKDFFKEMGRKINFASKFPDVSFTKFSENILKNNNQVMYSNVYYKGALIAFLLDIEIHRLTKGKQSLHKAILLLIQKYGDHHAFDDDTFITELVGLTHPQIAAFFEKYVIGNKPLPYAYFFKKIGVKYYDKLVEPIGTYGQFTTYRDFKTGEISFYKTRKNTLGIKPKDIILKINGTPINTGNFNDFSHHLHQPKINEPIHLEVSRKGKPIKLIRTPFVYQQTFEHTFRNLKKMDAKTIALRRKFFESLN